MIFLLGCWVGGTTPEKQQDLTDDDTTNDTGSNVDTDTDTDTISDGIREITIHHSVPTDLDLETANGEYDESQHYVCLDLIASVVFEDEPAEVPVVNYRWEVWNKGTPEEITTHEGSSSDGSITLTTGNYTKDDEIALVVALADLDIEEYGQKSEVISFVDTTLELTADPDALDGNSAETGIWLYAQLAGPFGSERYKHEEEPFLDCEGDVTSFNIGFYSAVTGEDPFSSGPQDNSPFANCFNDEDCAISIRAGDDWGAYQYRTTLDAITTEEVESYADFKEGEAMVEGTLLNSPVDSISIDLSQASGSGPITNDFSKNTNLDCNLRYRDFDQNAQVSNTVFYHAPENDPTNWQVITSGTVNGSTLEPDSTTGSWAPLGYTAVIFIVKCEVTITDPGQNGIFDTSDNHPYDAVSSSCSVSPM